MGLNMTSRTWSTITTTGKHAVSYIHCYIVTSGTYMEISVSGECTVVVVVVWRYRLHERDSGCVRESQT